MILKATQTLAIKRTFPAAGGSDLLIDLVQFNNHGEIVNVFELYWSVSAKQFYLKLLEFFGYGDAWGTSYSGTQYTKYTNAQNFNVPQAGSDNPTVSEGQSLFFYPYGLSLEPDTRYAKDVPNSYLMLSDLSFFYRGGVSEIPAIAMDLHVKRLQNATSQSAQIALLSSINFLETLADEK